MEKLISEMGIEISNEEMEALQSLTNNGEGSYLFGDDSDDDSSDSELEGSTVSLPEFQDLEEVVFERYKSYHPKDLIPSEEKLVALFLREFNDAFCELETEYEDDEDEVNIIIEDYQRDLKNLKKKKKYIKIKNVKKKLETLQEKQKIKKQEFLKKKDELEKYYCFVCINTIKCHPEPPSELSSILNLLQKNASTLHAICLHLNHFSYIDSDLDDDSDDELPSMDGDEFSDEEFPILPDLVQDSDSD